MNVPIWTLVATLMLVVAVGAFLLGKRTTAPGAKPWWASATLGFNALTAALAVLEANFGALRAHLGPDAYLMASMLFAAINVAIRFRTSQPIK
jgi:hypothetical protein